MCGIVGIYNKKKNIKQNESLIKKMNQTLKQRGLDHEGYFISNHLLLGHQRLAIIDLENGSQPMEYDGYTIVYNGEVYNTNELKFNLRIGYFKMNEWIQGLKITAQFNMHRRKDTWQSWTGCFKMIE